MDTQLERFNSHTTELVTVLLENGLINRSSGKREARSMISTYYTLIESKTKSLYDYKIVGSRSVQLLWGIITLTKYPKKNIPVLSSWSIEMYLENGAAIDNPTWIIRGLLKWLHIRPRNWLRVLKQVIFNGYGWEIIKAGAKLGYQGESQELGIMMMMIVMIMINYCCLPFCPKQFSSAERGLYEYFCRRSYNKEKVKKMNVCFRDCRKLPHGSSWWNEAVAASYTWLLSCAS